MKKLNKILAILLSLSAIALFATCGKNKNETQNSAPSTSSEQTTDSENNISLENETDNIGGIPGSDSELTWE